MFLDHLESGSMTVAYWESTLGCKHDEEVVLNNMKSVGVTVGDMACHVCMYEVMYTHLNALHYFHTLPFFMFHIHKRDINSKLANT